MSSDVESATRTSFAKVSDLEEGQLDLNADMVGDYGLTSMNKVLFLISVCEGLDVSLSTFTEADLAGMRTLRDVVDAMADRRQPSGTGATT